MKTRTLPKRAVMIILMCFIASFIHVSSSESNERTLTWEEKLRRDIPNYILHPDQKCINNTVADHFNLRYYTFDERTQELYMYSYMVLKWYDDSLKWNPKDYGGIDRTTVRTATIWTPKIIEMEDNSDIFDSMHFYTSSFMVYHDGRVTCIPEMSHSGECQSRIRDWPYDIHTCQIKFVEKGVRITRNGTTGVSTKDAKQSAGWNIILSAYTESDEKPDERTLTFVIERAADGLAAIFVIPMIIVAVLNITAILIDVDNILRVEVLCFCLLSCVNFVTENYPKFGSDVPKILILLKTSFFLSALSIFATYIFKNLKRKKDSPPVYVLRFNRMILERCRKVFKTEKSEIEEVTNQSVYSEEWNVFVENRILIVLISIVYFVLFVFYVPRRTY